MLYCGYVDVKNVEYSYMYVILFIYLYVKSFGRCLVELILEFVYSLFFFYKNFLED